MIGDEYPKFVSGKPLLDQLTADNLTKLVALLKKCAIRDVKNGSFTIDDGGTTIICGGTNRGGGSSAGAYPFKVYSKSSGSTAKIAAPACLDNLAHGSRPR